LAAHGRQINIAPAASGLAKDDGANNVGLPHFSQASLRVPAIGNLPAGRRSASAPMIALRWSVTTQLRCVTVRSRTGTSACEIPCRLASAQSRLSALRGLRGLARLLRAWAWLLGASSALPWLAPAEA